MMLTRALLLLLAMMTGLSAAQAAESARPVHGTPGLSVALASTHVAPTEYQAHRRVSAFVSVKRIDAFDRAAVQQNFFTNIEVPIAPRTHRADRARE